MSTFMANKGNIVRKWYILDAAGKPLGKTAAAAATLLRGKHKPEFTPHADCGDFVVIVNAEKAVLTGKKLEQKYYRRHSGWIGGLKETKYRLLMQQKPELAMQLAVLQSRLTAQEQPGKAAVTGPADNLSTKAAADAMGLGKENR